MFSMINSVLQLKPKRKVNKKKKVVKKRSIKKKGGSKHSKKKKRPIKKKSLKKKRPIKRKVKRGGSKKGLKQMKYDENKDKDFVLFYSDQCPHCVVFKDRLNKIKNKVSCKIMMIDAWDNKNSDIVNKYQISGVPSLMDKNMNNINIPTSDPELINLLDV